MSKIEQLYKEWISLQPLKSEYQSRLNQKFMLEFNYNSNHIEGNTLTYGQTELLLRFGKVVDEAKMKDLEEMKAHNLGLNIMQSEASMKERPMTELFIKELHRTLLREDYKVYRSEPDGTSTCYTVHAGRYKTRPNSVVTVTGERFEYASPEETPALMYDLVMWYNDAEIQALLSPIELASLFHYRYIRIHPFEDGNGRISRLMVNYILLRHNYPMLVVKSRDKDAYLTALNRCDVMVGSIPSDGAHAELAQITPFKDYMEGCLERALTVCIKAAKGESIEEEDDFEKRVKLLEQEAIARKKRSLELNQAEIDRLKRQLDEIALRLKNKLGVLRNFYEKIDCDVFFSQGEKLMLYDGVVIYCACYQVNPNVLDKNSRIDYQINIEFEKLQYRIDNIDRRYNYGVDIPQRDIDLIENMVRGGLLELLEKEMKK